MKSYFSSEKQNRRMFELSRSEEKHLYNWKLEIFYLKRHERIRCNHFDKYEHIFKNFSSFSFFFAFSLFRLKPDRMIWSKQGWIHGISRLLFFFFFAHKKIDYGCTDVPTDWRTYILFKITFWTVFFFLLFLVILDFPLFWFIDRLRVAIS